MSQKLGFIFAGQGAQAVGMGRELAAESSAARALFEAADRVLERPLSAICFEGPQEALTASRNCQPAIYTMSCACLAAFQERTGLLLPTVCGGLSLGEFGALQAAGVLSFEAGLKLVAARGGFMEEACRNSDGAMAAVLNADIELLSEVCEKYGIDIANYNCPGQTVVSGGKAQVEGAVEALRGAGVSRVIMLEVDGAFHSRLMAPAAAQFAGVLMGIELQSPKCLLVQNYPGGAVSDPETIRANLKEQITGSVKWEQCVMAMLASGVEAMVEFGPGKVLAGFMRRIDRRIPVYNVGTIEDLEQAVAGLGH